MEKGVKEMKSLAVEVLLERLNLLESEAPEHLKAEMRYLKEATKAINKIENGSLCSTLISILTIAAFKTNLLPKVGKVVQDVLFSGLHEPSCERVGSPEISKTELSGVVNAEGERISVEELLRQTEGGG